MTALTVPSGVPASRRRAPASPAVRGPGALAALCVVLALLSATALLWARGVVRDAAVDHAVARAQELAISTLGPAGDGLLEGDAAALEAVDAAVRARMAHGTLTRVKVWTADGRIVYSDEPRYIGRSFDLSDSEAAVVATGGTHAELRRPAEAENQFEDPAVPLVEVYATATSRSGRPLIFEAYFPQDDVVARERLLLTRLAPAGLPPLALALAVTPLAVVSLRRARAANGRRRVLAAVVRAGEHRCRRLSAYLRDDVVQDLAGVGYALGALASAAGPQARPLVDDAAGVLRHDVTTLCRLADELDAPEVDAGTLAAALDRAAQPLAVRGVAVDVQVGPRLPVDDATATLLLHVARECLANVERHASARRVGVVVAATRRRVRLEVTDDGVGFAGADGRPPGGPVPAVRPTGLRLVTDAVGQAGGSVRFTSDDAGTRVEVELPPVWP